MKQKNICVIVCDPSNDNYFPHNFFTYFQRTGADKNTNRPPNFFSSNHLVSHKEWKYWLRPTLWWQILSTTTEFTRYFLICKRTRFTSRRSDFCSSLHAIFLFKIELSMSSHIICSIELFKSYKNILFGKRKTFCHLRNRKANCRGYMCFFHIRRYFSALQQIFVFKIEMNIFSRNTYSIELFKSYKLK